MVKNAVVVTNSKKCIFYPEISCVRRIYVCDFQIRRAISNIRISDVKGEGKSPPPCSQTSQLRDLY